MSTPVALIWAMADNGVIGAGNDMPWHQPADLRWFREWTEGRPVIVGRRTLDSFGGRPLPRRTNIVITRDPAGLPETVVPVTDPDAALAAVPADTDWAMVIGGAQVYAEFLPRADRLIVTRIHARPEGDTHFPEVDWTQWQRVEAREYPADAENPHPMTFEVYDRAE